MARTKDGWAVLLPYEYQGETISIDGYDISEIIGNYEFINSGNITNKRASAEADISTMILPTQTIELCSDGSIRGLFKYTSTSTDTAVEATSAEGAWQMEEGTCYATFTVGDVTYSGVFCMQKEENYLASVVMTFAGAGSDNSTVMAVKIR